MDSFEEYLVQKKIDPKRFKDAEKGRYKEFATLYSQVHPNSFTMQKLNLINFIRRKYPLVDELVSKDESQDTGQEAPKASRPVFKRKT